MKAYMNVAEAALEAGISEQTIERALAAGDLKPVSGLTISGNPVRRTVISQGDLVAWVEGAKSTTARPRQVSVPTKRGT